MVEALRAPRYEVLPLAGVAEEAGAVVPRQVTLTVTASPRQGLDATLALTEHLSRAGFRSVPHLAARQVVDDAHLHEIVRRMDESGVREVFVVAGDLETPLGAYADSAGLLRSMHRLGHPFERVGIAGYPEGHPFISNAELARSLADKAPFASYLVSQLCFDPAAVSAWVGRLRVQGVRLPVHLGVAGAVDRRRLLRVATRIGVGQSAQFLRKHRHAMLRLALPGGYRPDRLVRDLAGELAAPDRRVDGLHVYTLNDLRATEQWRLRVLDRLEEAA